MTYLEYFLARRYLSSHRGRGLSVITWIALLGVVVGVMCLVTVLAVMSGFERDLKVKILGNNAHLLVNLVPTSGDVKTDLANALREIKDMPDVLSAMPVIYGEGFILSPHGGSDGVFLKGVDPETVDQVLDLKKYLEKGAWGDFESGGVILGDTLGQNLLLSPGDTFTLVLNRGDISPLGMMPRMKRLKVADTFHSGMTQYDAHHGYISLDLAEKLFDAKPRMIEVRARDVLHIARVAEQIRRGVPEASSVQDWLALNQDLLSALRLEKTVMAVILGLIILVASFNICASLIMVVRDKARDIAILKSMGALDRTILKIFLGQGLFIGLVGTAVGLVLGVAMSFVLKNYIRFPLDKNVYMIDTLPVDIRLADILLVTFGAVVISTLATLYPAFLASKMIPTEGLKAD